MFWFGELISSYRLMAEKCQQAFLCWRFTLSDVVEDRVDTYSTAYRSNHSKSGLPPFVPLHKLKISNYISISKAKVGPPSVQLQYHSDSRASTFHSRLLVPPIIHLICTNCGLCCAVAGAAGYCNNVRVITR